MKREQLRRTDSRLLSSQCVGESRPLPLGGGHCSNSIDNKHPPPPSPPCIDRRRPRRVAAFSPPLLHPQNVKKQPGCGAQPLPVPPHPKKNPFFFPAPPPNPSSSAGFLQKTPSCPYLFLLSPSPPLASHMDDLQKVGRREREKGGQCNSFFPFPLLTVLSLPLVEKKGRLSTIVMRSWRFVWQCLFTFSLSKYMNWRSTSPKNSKI